LLSLFVYLVVADKFASSHAFRLVSALVHELRATKRAH